MNFSRILLFAVLVVGGLLLPTRTTLAQPQGDLRQAESEFVTLKKQLDRLNQEIAALKRLDRSLRNDYRLRDQLAEAEALAQKVTQKEAQINQLKGALPAAKNETILTATPKATAEDNPFELEAKADLLADQSVRLIEEADRLQKASVESRKRQAMRRQAGKWDRDPFASFESSKRQLPAQIGRSSQAPTNLTKPATQGEGDPKPANQGAGNPAIVLPESNSPSKPTQSGVGAAGDLVSNGAIVPPVVAATPGTASGEKQSTFGSTTTLGMDSATSTAKTAPVPVTIGSTDRGVGEYRIFLDPSTAALVRNALRSDGAPYDPESLLRAAEVLRTRAKNLSKESKDLRARSQRP